MRTVILISSLLLSAGLQAKEIPKRIQNGLCASTSDNNSSRLLLSTQMSSINSKRDFDKIYCSDDYNLDGGNLFQTAFHNNSFDVLISFVKVHKLSINRLDKEGNTLLDWVDNMIATYGKMAMTKLQKITPIYLKRLLKMSAKTTAKLKL